ncbi:MAG: response regulator [Proteobacteria bacterium]|nr:response regulator [Pseudomonadota bacterium]MBU1685949.1 response regulator [Pseudomonadota bacterium]
MALRITLIIIFATSLSYWHMHNTLRATIFKNLSTYVNLRGKLESEQFLLAERQSTLLRDEFLRRLEAIGDYDPQDEFDQIFVRESDGLIRVRPEINDHRHHATAYLRNDVLLTPDLRRRFFIGWQLMDQWGPMLTNRFFSGFMNMPEQLSINFCPSADWGRSATPETDITIYETVWGSTIEKNPWRLPFWTTVYYDPGATAWMVSRVTPGDYQGRWVVTGGQDVEISDLINRATANPIMEGTWNYIVDTQGNLIAHPDLTAKIAQAGGNLQVNQLGDQRLIEMVKAVLNSKDKNTHTLELPELDIFLGVTQISGPGWYFVTVYPKRLITAQILPTARIFLLVGFATLLLELLIMATILRRRIAIPIAQAVSATEQISHGDFKVRLNSERNDELGILAASVNRMAEEVGERDATLTRQFNELKEAKQIQQEQQKHECIGTLAGGIAHDFNNILSAIIGYTDLAMLREKRDEEWRNDLQEVLNASSRATTLVRQILTVSRRQQHEKVPVFISVIVKEALKLLRATIPSTIEIRQDIIPPAPVLATPGQIHQVVMNLCTNAYQSMMETGGILSVTLEELTLEPTSTLGINLPPGRYALLSVSDTGHGMDEETMSKIFDPYYTTKEHGKGTGLGLAVAQSIIESHNGRITVKSTPDQGAFFRVYLPLTIEEVSTDRINRTPTTPINQGHGIIMVVDDESSLRKLLSQALTLGGYQVDTYANGRDAWKALSHTPHHWDLIITDQTMPEMTGDQLAAKALTIQPDLPIILCSGYSATLKLDQLKTDRISYVEKPLEINELLSLIAKILPAKN